MSKANQTLTIAIRGESKDLITNLENVEQVLSEIGVSTAKTMATIDTKTGESTTKFKLLGNEIKNVNSLLRKVRTSVTDGTSVDPSVSGTNKSDYTKRLEIAQEFQKKTLEKTRRAIKLRQLEITKGLNAEATIRETYRQKQITAEEAFNRKLANIAASFTRKDISYVSALHQSNVAADKYAKTIERLSRAQHKATTQTKIHKKFQDLVNASIKRGNTYTARRVVLQKRVTKAVANTKAGIHSLVDANKSVLRHVTQIVAQYRLVNSVINGIIEAIKNVPKAGISLQATEASLAGTFGTTATTENLKFLVDIADKYGLQLQALEESYRSFAPAAKIAGATQAEVNQIFEDFSAVGTILHKTPDQLQSIFIALEQMFTKTVVNAEEMKRQLGNQIPAAMAVGAQANEQYSADFVKSMKRNEVVATKFIPKFAKLYRYIFAGEGEVVLNTLANKLQANYNRVITQYTIVNRRVFEASEGLLTKGLTLLQKPLTFLLENFTAVTQVVKGLAIVLTLRLGTALIATTAHMIELGVASAFLTKTQLVNGVQVVTKEFIGLGAVAANTGSSIVSLLTKLTGLGTKSLIFVGAITAISKALLGLSDVQFKYGKLAKGTEGDLTELTNKYLESADALKKLPEEANAALVKAKAQAVADNFELLTQLAEFQDTSNQTFVQIGEQSVSLSSYMSSTFTLFLEELTKNYEILADNIEIIYTRIANIVKEKIDDAARYFKKSSIYGLTQEVFGAFQKAVKPITDILNPSLTTTNELIDQTVRGFSAFQKEVAADAAAKDQEKVNNRVREYIKLQIAAFKKLKEFREQQERLANKQAIRAEKTAQQEALRQELAIKRTKLALALIKGDFEEVNRLRAEIFFAPKLLEFEGNEEILKKVKLTKDLTVLEGEYRNALKQSNDVQEAISHSIDVITAKEQAGIEGSISAMYRRSEQAKLAIEEQERLVAISEKALQGKGAESQRLKDEALNAKRELDLLKIRSTELTTYIRNSLSDALGNSFYSFTIGAKSAGEAMRDFATTILQQVARIAAKELAVNLINLVIGSFPSSGGGTLLESGASDALSSFNASFAQGGAFSKGRIIPYASGAVLDKPTLFPMAKGNVGLMGESGPEAILPLARTAKGDLGVQTSGGSNGIVIQNMNISVVQDEDTTASEQGRLIAEAFKANIETAIDRKIQASTRPGGILNPTRIQASFA